MLQDNVFAESGSLGTPTQSAVQAFFNRQKVPQLFIESGCNCSSSPKYPLSLGWQPPYTINGKILGAYVKSNFAGKKIGYLSQDDEFGQDVVKGLDMEIPSSSVVSRQTYDAATLAGPLSNQMAALKAAGAQVVVLATIPAATAARDAARPRSSATRRSTSSTASVRTPPTVGPLLASFTQKGGGTAAQAAAAGGLLNGVDHDGLLRARVRHVQRVGADGEEAPADSTRRRSTPSTGLDGNTQYGIALAYTFVQALQKAGKNLTRQSLLDAINRTGRASSRQASCRCRTRARCTSGSRAKRSSSWSSSAPPAVTPTGTWIGGVPVTPVEMTSPGAGPIKKYTGPTSTPPKSLSSTA